jgi:hypothetical protein
VGQIQWAMKSFASSFVATRIVLLTVCIVICTAAPLQVVSVDGTCRSASQIGSYVSSQPISQTGNMCPVSSLIDCSSENDGSIIFNSLLDTSFEANFKGNILLVDIYTGKFYG